jgi:hypothetical protein
MQQRGGVTRGFREALPDSARPCPSGRTAPTRHLLALHDDVSLHLVIRHLILDRSLNANLRRH